MAAAAVKIESTAGVLISRRRRHSRLVVAVTLVGKEQKKEIARPQRPNNEKIEGVKIGETEGE